MNILNRLLAFVVGVALAGAAALAVAEIVVALLGFAPLVIPRSNWHQTMGSLRWDEGVLIAVAVGMVVVGIALVLAQLVPRRPRELSLAATDSAREAHIDRRGLQHRLRSVATEDPDVVDARVRIRRKAKVRADVLARSDRGDAKRRLGDALSGQLASVGLQRPPRVAVQLRRGKERVR